MTGGKGVPRAVSSSPPPLLAAASSVPPQAPGGHTALTSLCCMGRAVSSSRPRPSASEPGHQINQRNPFEVLIRIPLISDVSVCKVSSHPSSIGASPHCVEGTRELLRTRLSDEEADPSK